MEVYIQQVYWLVLGGILAAVVAVIDYRHYERLGYLLYALGIVLLLLVFILGKDIRGAIIDATDVIKRSADVSVFVEKREDSAYRGELWEAMNPSAPTVAPSAHAAFPLFCCMFQVTEEVRERAHVRGVMMMRAVCACIW